MSDFLINPYLETAPPFAIAATLTLDPTEVSIEGITTDGTYVYVATNSATQWTVGDRKIVKIDPSTMTRVTASPTRPGGGVSFNDALKYVGGELITLTYYGGARYDQFVAATMAYKAGNVYNSNPSYGLGVSRAGSPLGSRIYTPGWYSSGTLYIWNLTGSPTDYLLFPNSTMSEAVVVQHHVDVSFIIQYAATTQIHWLGGLENPPATYVSSTSLNPNEANAVCASRLGNSLYVGTQGAGTDGRVIKVDIPSKSRLLSNVVSSGTQVRAVEALGDVVFCAATAGDGSPSIIKKLLASDLSTYYGEGGAMVSLTGTVRNMIRLDNYLYAVTGENPGKVHKIGIGRVA